MRVAAAEWSGSGFPMARTKLVMSSSVTPDSGAEVWGAVDAEVSPVAEGTLSEPPQPATTATIDAHATRPLKRRRTMCGPYAPTRVLPSKISRIVGARRSLHYFLR